MATAGPERENEQELRLALAMRGGASMAVWIGGAVAEIDRLRRSLPQPAEPASDAAPARDAADFRDNGDARDAGPAEDSPSPEDAPEAGNPGTAAHARDPGSPQGAGTSQETGTSQNRADPHEDARPHPWAALARLAGYDSVSVDVLAGTSAGGLNATLLAASIVYGMPFDEMRGMWVRLADLEAMSRPVPKWWQPRPESLLEGDDYLRSELARVLKQNVPSRDGAPSAANPGERADLLLTATLLDPVREPHFDDRSDPLPQERRTASFRFRHEGRPGQPLSDFGSGKDFEDTALRLAHAARTTSSYPFAFEPSRVHSSAGKPPGGAPDMFGLFSEVTAGPDAAPFRVVDGGVLDNIPVTAAIDSIASASADRPTDRWLLYLNPDPTSQPEKAPSRLALPVASAAMRARLTQESLLADIRALDEHNEAVDRMSLRREALFAELRAASPAERADALARQVSKVEPSHAVVRAELDAQAVHRLLTRPVGAEDGTLLPPVVDDPLTGWSAVARTELPDRLSATLAEQAAEEPGRVFDDVRGLLSGVQQCLGWVRDVERWVPRSNTAEVGACKAALYRLQVFGDVLEGHADRYWVHGAKLEPIVELGELDGWARRVVQRRRRLQHQLPSPIGPLLGAVLDGVEGGPRFQRPLAEFAAELLSIVDSSGADAVAEDGGRVDAVAEARAVLHRIAARLAAVAPERAQVEQPEELGYVLLEHERPEDVLRQLVVLTAPLDVGRAPGSRINFLRVASDAATPLPFDALGSGGGELGTEDKIRGSDLGNFGAFLSAKWRANDWMWGRLDAAASLVDLLVDPARLVRRNAELGPGGLADAFEEIVRNPSDAEMEGLGAAEIQQWQRFLGELWDARADAVRAELAAAFARSADEHPMTETKRAVTERLQWTIAAREVPFVSGVRSGADPQFQDDSRVGEPKRLRGEVRRYSVGRQRLPDLGERRTASVANRFGMLAYRAVRPTGPGVLKWLGRWAMTLLKPVLLIAAFAVAAPVRAALLGFLSVTSVAFTGHGTGGGAAGEPDPPHTDAAGACPPGDASGCGVSWAATSPPVRGGSWQWLYDFSGTSFGPGSVVAAVLVVVFALWLGWQLAGRISRSGPARWLVGLLVAGAALGGAFWLLTTGFRLGPAGLGAAAVVITGWAAFAYRIAGRLLAMLVTAVAFLLATWWFTDPSGSDGAPWTGAFLVLAAYGQVLLGATVDLLKPRPRPAR